MLLSLVLLNGRSSLIPVPPITSALNVPSFNRTYVPSLCTPSKVSTVPLPTPWASAILTYASLLDTSSLLKDALFVPSCSTRLVSISSLARDGYNFVTFGPDECWVSNRHNKVIVRGSISSTKGLYLLNCQSARVTQPKSSSTALYSKRVPDLETLAPPPRSTVITGPLLTWHATTSSKVCLSTFPPPHLDVTTASSGSRCDHRCLGVRDGTKATSPLERVYVDLCGSMPVPSKSGHVYSMNVIDDYSVYIWSLPLKLKSDAASVLRGWHRAVENQSGHKLKILVTDNGELISKTMEDWCMSFGIDHQCTALYTLAHNGRAERLHRTILGRACAMRLACNAPASLWDEFCATAAYLANFTGSSAIDGKTPHELWFKRLPSLSHLREIGCRTFALIQMHNSKLYCRSTPCTLIGYTPHSKAYCLWDNTSGRHLQFFPRHIHRTPRITNHQIFSQALLFFSIPTHLPLGILLLPHLSPLLLPRQLPLRNTSPFPLPV